MGPIIVKPGDTVLIDVGNNLFRSFIIPEQSLRKKNRVSEFGPLNRKLSLFIRAYKTGRWSNGASYSKSLALDHVSKLVTQIGRPNISKKNLSALKNLPSLKYKLPDAE